MSKNSLSKISQFLKQFFTKKDLVFFVILLLIFSKIAFSQSRWVEKDLYSPKKELRMGSILYVVLNKGIKAEWESEYKTNDFHKIRSNPDRKFLSELPNFYSDLSVDKLEKGKVRNDGKVIGVMGVVIRSQDPTTGNLQLEGFRETTFDGELQSLRLTGLVNPEDIQREKVISSEKIANLRLEFQGAIQKKEIRDPELKLKRTGPNDPINPNAEGVADLSEKEKQQILLKYIKRMLGESL